MLVAIWIGGRTDFDAWHKCKVRPKFAGGLGAVRTGIALFWATKAIPCAVCKSRKAL
jgi:hypothetical protein